MPTVAEKDVKDVVEQIVDLKRTILGQGKAGLNDLPPDDRVKDILTGEGQFNRDAWGQIPDAKKSGRFNELLEVRDLLASISSPKQLLPIKPVLAPLPDEPPKSSGTAPPPIPPLNGPDDPQHVMYATYASTKAVYGCIAFGGILLVTLLYLIISLWDDALRLDYAVKINAASAAITLLEEARNNSNAAAEKARGTQNTLAAEKKPLDSLVAIGPTDTTPKTSIAELDTPETKDAAEKQRIKEHAQQTAAIAAIDAVKAIKENKGANESTVLQMIILLGALGGSLHLLGSLVNYVGERKLKRSWLPYYFSLPLVGAALAPIVYMLLRVGILTPTGQGNGGTAIANLNLISIYAFAALTGMFAKIATEKLGDVFAAMFQARPERIKSDKLDPDKPAGTLETARPKP